MENSKSIENKKKVNKRKKVKKEEMDNRGEERQLVQGRARVMNWWSKGVQRLVIVVVVNCLYSHAVLWHLAAVAAFCRVCL